MLAANLFCIFVFLCGTTGLYRGGVRNEKQVIKKQLKK